MSPVTIVEGAQRIDRPQPVASPSPVGERNVAERRLSALAEAVRDHQNKGRRVSRTQRYHDDELYQRLRQICGKR